MQLIQPNSTQSMESGPPPNHAEASVAPAHSLMVMQILKQFDESQRQQEAQRAALRVLSSVHFQLTIFFSMRRPYVPGILSTNRHSSATT